MDHKSGKTRVNSKSKAKPIVERKSRKRKARPNKKSAEEEDIVAEEEERESDCKIQTKRSLLMPRLCVDFFQSKTCVQLSKALLGQILCRKVAANGPVLKAIIVETEAYLGSEDKASATYNGRRTEHLEPLYMSGGTCFVYMTYGMYHLINLSAAAPGEAVLLRAVEPLDGIECMERFRAKSRKSGTDKPFKPNALTSGPSKLCQAFDINKSNTNKVDITQSDVIWLESGRTIAPEDIISAKRIGIGRAQEWAEKLLRFYIKDNEFVSQK